MTGITLGPVIDALGSPSAAGPLLAALEPCLWALGVVNADFFGETGLKPNHPTKEKMIDHNRCLF